MKAMKNALGRALTVLLAFAVLLPSLTVQVYAAPVDVPPYEVQVTAEDGQGVNMRSGPASTYDKVRATPIPMWEILTVTKEETNSYGKLWGYVTYDGVSGWISMTEVTRLPVDQGSSVNGPEDVIFFQDSGTVTGEMAAAYLNVIDNIANTYGIYRGTVSDNGFYFCDDLDAYISGLSTTRLIDFDNNGLAELFLMYVKHDQYTGTKLVGELWYFDGSTAVQVFSMEQDYPEYGYDVHNWELVEYLGKIFWCEHINTYRGGGWEYDVLYQFANGSVSKYYEKNVTTSPEGEESISIDGDTNCDLTNSERITENGVGYILYWKASDVDQMRSYLLNVTLTQKIADGASPLELLDGIAYIGERSKCRMDEDMANAFAKVLEEQPYARNGYGDESLSALLVELSGDGYPVLLTLYRDNYETELCSVATVWEYRNGTAVAYDFSKDFSCYSDPDPNDFRVGGGYLVASSTGGGGVNPVMGSCYYEVIGGRLVLRHTAVIYVPMDYPGDTIYTLDGKSYADGYEVGEQITDPPAHYKESHTIVECGSDLFLETDVTDAKAASALLRAYAQAAAFSYTYPKITEDDDRDLVEAIADAIANAVGGEVQGIYKLADGVYYVVIVVDGEKKSAMVYGKRTDGEVSWSVGEIYDAPLSNEELDKAAADYHTTSNVTLDYGKIGTEPEGIGNYLVEILQNMDGVTPNDAAKGDLASFIESAVSTICTEKLKAADNRLEVTEDTVEALVEKAKDTKDELEDTLEENDVSLNKTLTILVRIVWTNVDKEQPFQITLDESAVEALDGCTLQILLGDARHYIQISAQRLKELIELYGKVVIQISDEGENTYTINFVDEDDEVLEQIGAAVTVGLPAEDELSTVMVSYAGASDNWGGQYDPGAGVLSFETQFSGQYEVLHNSVTITDIDHLSEEARAAIAFMVSKGYLALEGDAFLPESTLTRYDFTRALVGMFFALDRELTTDFGDVPADSVYYPYVASAQSRSIVEGFDDGTFGGDKNITVEQMLALAARTLTDQKGYAAPENAEEYLASFRDADEIGAWARQLVALAIREGIVDRGGMLSPKAEITREQAALILYRLFLLLYEVPPVALELPEITKEDTTTGLFEEIGFTMPDAPVIIVGAVGAVTMVTLTAVGIFLVRRRKTGK